MKKLIVLLVCLTFCMVNGVGVLAKETRPAGLLPAVVAQSCGQANTVTMWHDINDDGKADYKATYVFKDGKLHRLGKGQFAQDEAGYVLKER
ncbi:MAG: hypothetical protein WBM69_00140 [Desulfobacterales bacterium]